LQLHYFNTALATALFSSNSVSILAASTNSFSFSATIVASASAFYFSSFSALDFAFSSSNFCFF
jgi:hypothetical protein